MIKSRLKEGSGWKKPKPGDEVKMCMKVTKVDDSVDKKNGFEYTVGDGSLGFLSTTIDKALVGMYAEGVTIGLTLEQVFEAKDVSFAKDQTMKKASKEGEGYDTAKDTAKVKLSVESDTDSAASLDGFSTVLELRRATAKSAMLCSALSRN